MEWLPKARRLKLVLAIALSKSVYCGFGVWAVIADTESSARTHAVVALLLWVLVVIAVLKASWLAIVPAASLCLLAAWDFITAFQLSQWGAGLPQYMVPIFIGYWIGVALLPAFVLWSVFSSTRKGQLA